MRALCVLAAHLAMLGGCTLVHPLDGLTCDGVGEPDPACAAASCVPGAGGAVCRFGQPCSEDGDCATGRCGASGTCECPGDMVTIQSAFCVDRTEVINAGYAAFVATGAKPDGKTAPCAWNVTFAIDVGFPDSPPECAPGPGRADDVPATCLDWCDAAAYCRFRGKRLCGKVGGGSVPLTKLADAAESQWFDACSGGGKRKFSTEDAPIDCNGDSAGPVAAGAPGKEICEGGVDGLQHMSGNVREWEDSCSGASSPEDDCRVRGGGFDTGANVDDAYAGIACDADETAKRSDTTFDIGFRCCAG